ncbi:hypothetical protein N7456_002263 [Penicillium angulare]|uniref:Uncharacterized protein n=1 Tax=Penicillium angulare TaxID=116970 RepID=A0A9W9KNU7_9EURO|nr:hypothetical protein N7456_002263 [Penicillium angulare]
MDTRNSRVALLQSQNNSPQLSVHSQPHGDAPSTSLLRPHEHHHDGPYHYERTDVKYKQFRRSCRPGLSVVTQIALCIILLGFLALAGLAIWMDGHPTGTTLGDRIEEALKVGSTVYTMVFAALLPEALKNIGRFKAQKGTALWTL